MESASSTPRRSQRIQKVSPSPSYSSPPKQPPITSKTTTTTTTKMAARRSPFLPTSLEAIVLAIYPSILVLGSIFALLDPTTRAAPYSTTTQSHHAATAPSYFAKKSNVFNVFFVKRGWAWVTLSYFFFLFTHPSAGPTFSVTAKRVNGGLRWAIVTVWWIFVTQWFFGPAIIDRGFLLTGGQCALEQQAQVGNVDMDEARQFVTHLACKAVGGKWQNGHDISGHVFLLVLGSMFLFEEVLNVVLQPAKAREERTVVMHDGAVKSAHVEGDGAAETLAYWTLGSKVAFGVGMLSLYMLLMTAAYFHTWFEKFTGLLVALSGIYLVYFVPRVIPAVRNVIGMPGV